MMSAVEGEIEFKGERFLVISAGGISYRVFVTAETLRKIPEKSEKIKVWTHLYLREDTIELYGFMHYAELEFFDLLIQIPGIGPKSGLAILGVAPVDRLKKAIAAGETSYLTKVSGIGRKTAEKVVFELRERLAGKGVSLSVAEFKEESDALAGLVSLGYSQSEAREALKLVPKEVVGAALRVREALKHLGRGDT